MENKQSKNILFDFPTEFELKQYGREMEIVTHPKVNEMVSEIKKCVYQFTSTADDESFCHRLFELVINIGKELRNIEAFCKKHEIPLNICVDYSGICCKDVHNMIPGYIYYSLKRGYLVVIDETFKEWADPDAFFDNFDSGYIKKDFYVNPELGIGSVGIQDGIVTIGNFVTEYDLPKVVWSYIDYLHELLEQNKIEVATEYI